MPDAFDSYAIQRPSGENVPLASSYAVPRKTDFVRSPESGNVHKSTPVAAAWSPYTRNRPSGDQSGADQGFRFHQ